MNPEMSDKLAAGVSYWSLPPDQLLTALETKTTGLSAAEASRRLAAVGPNHLRPKTQDTTLGLFLSQFKSPILLILIFATAVSAVLQDWTDAAVILLIVFGSGLLSFYQEYGAGKAAEKLRAQVTVRSNVLRDGVEQQLPSEQIVPGDVVLLSAGSLIPADGIVLEARDFFVNQAALTGETFPVEKAPGLAPADAGPAGRTNAVFMGSSVGSGSARVLIVETGAGTAFGQVAARLSLRPPETEFERGVRHLGYLLSEVMFILTLSIFAVNVYFHKPILDSLLFSIALAVGLTPQLLPAIINISLARGSQTMAQHGVIVRRLESIENFGSMDVLCTDKTGTLTIGVARLDAALDVLGQESGEVLRQAQRNSRFQTGMRNPLDQAIIEKSTIKDDPAEKVDEVPYDFVRKRLSVVVREDPTRPDPLSLITKGALMNVLGVCSRVQIGDQTPALEPALVQEIQRRFEDWSDQGYRVLGVAVKPVAVKNVFSVEDEQDLIFIGFLLFFDPPKPGVQATLEELRSLGVGVKIITGDNRLAARHTARAVGLEDVEALTGAELAHLRDEALWRRAEQTTIFAEVDPNQKERIILALKKTGHVVGYMGDGINDASALHAADVGISVDTAVDVAKEAADLVLLKQDLGVLREGILQGRKTFANTLKYVFMATSANFGNMFSVAGASLFLPFLPMLPKQILLINFLTDLPEMMIASDHVDAEYVNRPHRWDIPFIRRFMLTFGALSSFFDFAAFAVLLWVLHSGEAAFHTGWFIESVISAGLVVFAVRTRLPMQHSAPSRAMLGMTILVGAITVALPYSPLAPALGFTPLPAGALLPIFGIIAAYLLAAEWIKRRFYRRYRDPS